MKVFYARKWQLGNCLPEIFKNMFSC